MNKNRTNKNSAPQRKLETPDSMFQHQCNVASSGECTGLVQTPPQNEQEAASLMDIYDITYTD